MSIQHILQGLISSAHLGVGQNTHTHTHTHNPPPPTHTHTHTNPTTTSKQKQNKTIWPRHLLAKNRPRSVSATLADCGGCGNTYAYWLSSLLVFMNGKQRYGKHRQHGEIFMNPDRTTHPPWRVYTCIAVRAPGKRRGPQEVT